MHTPNARTEIDGNECSNVDHEIGTPGAWNWHVRTNSEGGGISGGKNSTGPERKKKNAPPKNPGSRSRMSPGNEAKKIKFQLHDVAVVLFQEGFRGLSPIPRDDLEIRPTDAEGGWSKNDTCSYEPAR